MCETEAFTLKTANSSDSYLAPSDDTDGNEYIRS